MQRFRSDVSERQPNGAVAWFADWLGGKTLAKIANCPIESLEGDMRRTVYATGDADTWFSIPAVTKIQSCRVKGYITCNEDGYVFRHVYY